MPAARHSHNEHARHGEDAVELKGHGSGTLVLIGQPAEEVIDGARAVLRDGLYERFPKPDYVIALHDSADLEAGKVGYTPGYAMASSTSVDIKIRGLGGHGARPESTKDPIVVAAQVIWRCKPSSAAKTRRSIRLS